MRKAAIAIDGWKLPIFKQHLADAGYTFEQSPGLTENTLTLTVITASVKELEIIVRAANNESRKRKLQ